MNKKALIFFLTFIAAIPCIAQDNIPAGSIKGPFLWSSTIYPGTVRNYWVYVPRQYNAAKPACLMVVQDGLSRANGWRLTSVLDSLINTKEIPVMIGVFIDHGTVPAADTSAFPRYNRSFEYDALGDRYAQFLSTEILPEISRNYNISKDPNDRSIAGASSGAICAFNAAWERPDEFRRVLSTIGTYVGLRGADELATLVRKTEPKPLRVFLEDGNNDLNIYAGNWWIANQLMLSSLTWAGYEVNHAWGGGGHDSKGGAAIMPEALKWLWKDYPAPVQVHIQPTNRLNLAVAGEGWKNIPFNVKATDIAIDKDGSLFFTSGATIYKLQSSGEPLQFVRMNGEAGPLSFSSDNILYVYNTTDKRIYAIRDNKPVAITGNVAASALAVSPKGLYFTEPGRNRIGFYNFSKKSLHYVASSGRPQALAITPEQSFLNAGTANGRFGYSFKIGQDGSLSEGQEYVHYHIPYGAASPGIARMTADRENILYTSTNMGIQASDQLGRVNYIFSNPAPHVTGIALGGDDFSILYALANGRLFSRKINARGFIPGNAPIKPPKPGL